MNEELHNDLGHGKNTYPPSKGVPGLPEFEFNNAVGIETKRLLQGLVPTYEAQPFNDVDVPLGTRTNLYNSRYEKNKKAIGISNHANANGNKNIRGFGVFYWHKSAEAKKLAQIILDEYKKEFPGYPIWGTGLFPSVLGTWTDLHICRETEGIFVLVEWEFMTNPDAYKLLKSDDYRKRCAMVNAKSVCRWYGIAFPNKVVAAAQKIEADSADGKLVRGERGPNVQLLNQMLKTLENTTKTDDLFDQYTEAALKVFQKEHGLQQDAIYTSSVGQVMLKVISEKDNKVKVDPLPVKAPEMVRLAKLIDTTNPELMKKLKADGYIVLDV